MPAPANVFELRIKIDNQINTLVAYQSTATFTLDGKIWGSNLKGATAHALRRPIRNPSRKK